jgi:ABC-2 type transport system permease protein
MFGRIPFYWSVMKYGLKSRLAYRMGAFLSTVGVLIQFLGRIMVWVALLASGVAFDTTLREMITFMILSMMLSEIVSSSAGYTIARRIRDGSIAIDFVRPIRLKSYLFFNDIGNNLFLALVVYLPVYAVIALGFGFMPPASPLHFIAFLITAGLGLIIQFYYSYILGLASFWLIKNPFISWHFRNVETLFAGLFMPIWMYPGWLASITTYLPFRYFTYEPMTFYLGRVPADRFWHVLLIQTMWLFVLYAAERFVWSRACLKVIVQGG